MQTINPYSNRGLILDSSKFFGRKRELAEVFSRLTTMQSISVIGERRIGKSSFLSRIADPTPSELDSTFSLHYLDLQRVFSATEFYERACRALKREQGESHIDLEEAIQGKKVIFCLDEFEQAYTQDFGSEFFNALRSLAQSSNLALVVATQTPLNELHAQFLTGEDVTSKFHNIFTTLGLGKFTSQEADAMVREARNGHRFSDEEAKAILELGDCHPFKLNLACSIFFAAKQEGLLNGGAFSAITSTELRERFTKELALIEPSLSAGKTHHQKSVGKTAEKKFSLVSALQSPPEESTYTQPKPTLVTTIKNLAIQLSVAFSVVTLILGFSGQGVATPFGIALVWGFALLALAFLLMASWINWKVSKGGNES
ncbi:MAG: hypothetical protein JST85_27895 [Acidobacteria bacterium]|nr:hypothetical protein [Acidobacteriota bacterium]